MRAVVVIIAGIIILLRHYLTSSRSQTHKPQSQDKNQNKARCTVQEKMMFNSNGIDVLDGSYPLRQHVCGSTSNCNAFDNLELRQPILGNVMEALADPNTHLGGVYGSDHEIKDTLLQRVYRRVQRDQLFGVVVTAKVTKYPDVRKIQEDIACQLGFTFNHISKEERAKELIHKIKNEHNILIVLCNLYKKLDLGKAGIPYGADHTGCKILLTSTAEDVLSNHMHTQRNFMV